MEKEYLNIEEVAQWYQLSKGTLRNWRTKQKGPKAVKVGRKLLYKITDVKAYMEKMYEDQN